MSSTTSNDAEPSPRSNGPLTAHLELWTGLAGDMWVGALLDAGWPETELRRLVTRLGIPELEVHVETRTHGGLAGKGIVVTSREASPHRGLPEITAILGDADLSGPVRDRALAVFRRLAEVEARVHGSSIETIHFHEVGALDAIVDIVAVVEGLEWLGVTRVTCGPIPISSGTVEIAHGKLPTPAPATARLLEGWPVRAVDVEGEFITPTAAALLSVLATPADVLPSLRLLRLGHGAGTRTHPRLPNLVRLWLGEDDASESPDVTALGPRVHRRDVTVLETQVDDMTAEDLAAAAAALRTRPEALEIVLEPVFMKKGRPGTRLQAIVEPGGEAEMARAILETTTTLGVRVRREGRWELRRIEETVESPWGPLRLKWVPRGAGGECKPEFEDLDQVAANHEMSLSEIRTHVQRWLATHVEPPSGL